MTNHCFCCSSRPRNTKRTDETIAMVSHDLRAPLTSIQFSLELLSMELQKGCSESALDELTVAQRNASRLITMIDQLLGAQKVSNSRWPISIQRLRLSTLMERAVECIQPIANKKNIEIQSFISEFEAGGNGHRLVDADGDRLLQVLVNLLSNAIKFSPDNSRIFISAKLVGKSVEIVVEDEGPGVPAELCTTIFDAYVQVKDVQVKDVQVKDVQVKDVQVKGAQVEIGNESSQAGIGLGLAISKEIVEQHKGTIGVRIRETGGSAFWFRIPMRAQTNTPKVINFPGIRAAN